jgi:hypothetical protein
MPPAKPVFPPREPVARRARPIGLRHREAECIAARFEAKLRAREAPRFSGVEWSKFRQRFVAELFPALSDATVKNYSRVFKLATFRSPSGLGGPARKGLAESAYWAGKIVSRIGRAAKVEMDGSRPGKRRHATANDPRRIFGARWARRVQPAVFQVLMRHANIRTAMEHYATLQAEETAAAIMATFERARSG